MVLGIVFLQDGQGMYRFLSPQNYSGGCARIGCAGGKNVYINSIPGMLKKDGGKDRGGKSRKGMFYEGKEDCVSGDVGNSAGIVRLRCKGRHCGCEEQF
jgi:hypothetical protein